MKYCPIHNRPLVTEHTSQKQICIPCYFEQRRAIRSERLTFTDPAANKRDKGYKAVKAAKAKKEITA